MRDRSPSVEVRHLPGTQAGGRSLNARSADDGMSADRSARCQFVDRRLRTAAVVNARSPGCSMSGRVYRRGCCDSQLPRARECPHDVLTVLRSGRLRGAGADCGHDDLGYFPLGWEIMTTCEAPLISVTVAPIRS